MKIPYARTLPANFPSLPPPPPENDPLEVILRARRKPFVVDGVTLYVRVPTLRESRQADYRERCWRTSIMADQSVTNLRELPPSAMFAEMVATQLRELRKLKKKSTETAAEIKRLENFSLLDEMAIDYASDERDMYLCHVLVEDEDGVEVFPEGEEDFLRHPDARRIFEACRSAIWQVRRDENRPLALVGQTGGAGAITLSSAKDLDYGPLTGDQAT